MHLERQCLERSLASESSRKSQTTEDHEGWLSSGFTFRVQCHYNKLFCVWKHTEHGPEVLGRFRVVNADLDTYTGLGICIETDLANDVDGMIWIDHKPKRLFGLDIFGHIPYFSEITYTPEPNRAENFVLRIPVVFKSKSNPNNPVVGDVYLTQVGEFRHTYPKFADMKL